MSRKPNKKRESIEQTAGVSKRRVNQMLRELGEEATLDIAEAKRILANYDAQKRRSDAEAASVRLERERIELQKAKGEVVLRAKMRDDGLRLSAVLNAELNALCNDSAVELEGLSSIEIRARLVSRCEKLKNEMKKQLQK